MERKIKIRALNIENEEVHFQIELANAVNSTSIDFYGYIDEFRSFGAELCSFPQNINHKIQYELGEQGNKWAYYILLRVFCYETNGYSAINNNREEPYKNYSEFCIMTVPASINKLGQLLKGWKMENEKEIEWIAE